jgi:PAS domain S-box-containing protein
VKRAQRAASKRPARPAASAEVARLSELLLEAQATLRAIRDGEVDAVVVDSSLGLKVFTLEGAEFDYRILVESMNEGALVLSRGAVILYANACFAAMAGRPLAQLMGGSLFDLLSSADQATLRRLLRGPGRLDAKTEVLLQRAYGEPLPVSVSIRRFSGNSREQSIGLVVSDLTESRRREELLRHFSRRLMQMQENERRQIATDLGDNITQLLCGILARCQLLAGRLPAHEQRFREEVLEFGSLLRTTTSEVHRISTELRPHGLEILGLTSALRGVAAEFAERMGVPIEVHCTKLPLSLPPATELALYRVLQEALRNVEQHAQAHHVRVGLKSRGALVQLAIRDDGIGFDARGLQAQGLQTGGFGLLSMRERASALGGRLELKSASSSGTEILLSVPLPPKNGAAS